MSLAYYFFYAPCFIFGLFAISTYFITPLYLAVFCRRERDLKKDYGAEWGLVTGGSSGIGLAIARRLAKQGINVVVTALDDHFLKSAAESLEKEFPNVEIRTVGVDFGKEGDAYLDAIVEKTKDLEVRLVFSNAGFVKPGLFTLLPLPTILSNHTTNITSHLKITHHFSRLLVASHSPGLVVFTSSSAGFLPNPLASLYAGTKAYMSAWAGSIAAELKPFGVDVTVVHPSPVASNFYANAVGFKMLEAPKASAQSPDSLVDHMFRGMGRVSILDQGGVTVAMRLGLKMADWGLITEAMRLFGGILPDFVNFRKRGLEECGIKDELVGGKWARKETKKRN